MKNPSGLGRAIINKKVKDAKKMQESGLVSSEVYWFSSYLIHRERQYAVDISSNNLKSVTQERDLDEFLNTAQLAATDFTAGT